MNHLDQHKRHIRLPHRTTIQLEQPFWSAIDLLAKREGMAWSQWAERVLADRPAGAGAASWLRVQCLQACLKTTKGRK